MKSVFFDPVWDSGLKYIEPKIIVPEKIIKLLKHIDRRLSGYEFNILFKAKWTDEGLRLLDDYVIPEQEVTMSSITMLEDCQKLRDRGYNVLVHSHPCDDFSAVDDEFQNPHYLAVLCYNNTRHKITSAVINVKINENLVLKVYAEVEVEEFSEEFNVDLSKIRIKKEVYLGKKTPSEIIDEYPYFF